MKTEAEVKEQLAYCQGRMEGISLGREVKEADKTRAETMVEVLTWVLSASASTGDSSP